MAVVVTAVSLLLNYAGLAARWADGYVAIVMALTGYFLVRLPSLWVEVGWMRTPPTTDRTAFAAFSTMTLIPTITVGAGVGVSYGLYEAVNTNDSTLGWTIVALSVAMTLPVGQLLLYMSAREQAGENQPIHLAGMDRTTEAYLKTLKAATKNRTEPKIRLMRRPRYAELARIADAADYPDRYPRGPVDAEPSSPLTTAAIIVRSVLALLLLVGSAMVLSDWVDSREPTLTTWLSLASFGCACGLAFKIGLEYRLAREQRLACSVAQAWEARADALAEQQRERDRQATALRETLSEVMAAQPKRWRSRFWR